MHPYLMLTLAIALELVATNALKASQGFTRPVPSVITVVGYAGSFYLMSLCLKELPLSVTYAIWSGVGTAVTALLGFLLWKEGVDLPRVLGILLIIGGVVLVNLNTKAPAAP